MNFKPIISAFLCVCLLPATSILAVEDTLLITETNYLLFVIPSFFLAVFLFIYSKIQFNRKMPVKLSFVSITPHRPQKQFLIDDTVLNMVSVVEALADENTNVYSNLNKITLSMKSNTVFMEDKNYKISILVNRRRSRRSFLNDGDILDMGELTIMFKSPVKRTQKFENKKQKSNHIIPRVRRVHGKILKSCPRLMPVEPRSKTFYLTKNVTLVGHSDMNDLIPKSKAISAMHSRIEKIAGRYKIVDLNSQSGTFVNGRRIDNRFLRDGDEISFESVKYTFSETVKKH